MRKLLILLVILISIFPLFPLISFAQNQTELWGMTQFGGNGGGLIFKTDSCGNNQQVIKTFLENSGANPGYGELCHAFDGKLYGMTIYGGANDMGVLFEYDPATLTYAAKIEFAGVTNGQNPYGSLVQASNGKLYGMTFRGGAADKGVLFEYDPATSSYTKKLDFAGATNGSSPYGSLTQATNGKLYGMTFHGGANNEGVLFEYDPTTSTYTKKLDFAGVTKGSYPQGSLTQATNGKLYGMTAGGGTNNDGVLFEYDPVTSTFAKKHNFAAATSGLNTLGSLVQASNGKLYGMNSQGGANNIGVLFEYDPATSTFAKKLDFAGLTNGSEPSGSMIQAPNGKLYGMTSTGGTSHYGVLFEYDPGTSVYVKKLDFVNTIDGYYPYGSLVQAYNGKIYGMTNKGGASDMGILFEYDLTTSTYSKKHDFANPTNGSNPLGSLVQASNGKLYGMTSYGGTTNAGMLFEINPATLTYTKKLDFADTINGYYPSGSLMQATNGKLYGMTSSGGANNYGVLFEYDPATSTYAKKIDFNGPNNGNCPFGSLIQASNGKLYGMTQYGGTSCYGNLFEYDPVTSICTKKFDFGGPVNGKYPQGTLVQSSNGKLYGMTKNGGVWDIGILFEYDPVTSTLTKMLDFTGLANGGYALGSLVQAANGKLYGMTQQGGTNYMGVIFEYDPFTSTFIKKLDFAGATNGRYPYGSMMQAANGKLYGMTRQGGAGDMGVIFEYDPATSTYTKRLDFNATNGRNPCYTQLIEICSPPKFTTSTPDISLCQGENTKFIASATGNGLLYQWQVDDGSGFIDLSNNAIYSDVTDDTLHVGGVLFSMNNFKYRCVVSSICPAISIESDTAVLTVFNSTASSITETACDSFLWNGTTYITSGDKTFVTTNAQGCDSTATLHLTINHSNSYTDVITACDSYTWINGTTYTASNNTATHTLTNAAGCDSVVTLDLTINHSNAFTDVVTVCDSYTWINGTTYTANNNTATYTLTNAAGCDSVVTLNLTINHSNANSDVVTACDSYTWINGTTYTASNNTASHSLTNAAGCDSIVTLNLTINHSNAFTDVVTACDSYTWINGITYTADNNIATHTLTNAAGCDSLVSLNLSISSVDVSVTSNGITLSAGASGATYQWTDCNNFYTPIIGATNQIFISDSNGDYAVIVTEGICSDTSICMLVNSIGIDETNPEILLNISPNPNNGQFSIKMNFSTQIEIMDALGKLIYTGQHHQGKEKINLGNISNGVYFIKASSTNQIKTYRMIIEK